MKKMKKTELETTKMAKRTRKNTRKKTSGLGRRMLILAAIGVLALSAAGCGGSSDSESAKADTSAASETEKGDSKEESEAKEETNTYKVGDSLEAGDLKITYLSAEEYKDYNEFSEPSDGNKVIKAGFEFENTGKSDAYVSSLEFSCYADGYDAQSYYYADEESLDATLSAGKKTKGYVLYEVPKDAKEVTLEYETDYWTDKKAVFVVE